jgi:uncharacterized repeat protein (TIGR03803 family)
LLYSFAGKDGSTPLAGLVDLKGTLYGTTQNGGAIACGGNQEGCGTVFSITTSGKETVLHSFGHSGDGQYPNAGLVDVNGMLYGTTSFGGAGCGSSGCGTVFSITTSGKETVRHSFGSSGDGRNPEAGLVNVNGMLYGTTENGGTGSCENDGCGTVFSVATSGKETVLHRFGVDGDGALPEAGLTDIDGTLYGTTVSYGLNGFGTVFYIKPKAAAPKLPL